MESTDQDALGSGPDEPLSRDYRSSVVDSVAPAVRRSLIWRLLIRLANFLAVIVQSVIYVVAALYGGMWMLRAFGAGGALGLMMGLWVLFFFAPAVAVHELGHFVAARIGGMRVVQLQVLYLQVVPQRKGWRIRWRRLGRKLGLSGFVMAFADPSRPVLAKRILTTAGGPAANVLVAAMLSMLALLPVGRVAWSLLAAFAAMNVAMGLSNLVPHKGRMGSDGFSILKLLLTRLVPESHPHARLIGLSLFGCTAERLPEQDVESLEKSPFPLPLVALWYRLKASQNLGEWEQAAAMRDSLDALLEDREPCLLSALRELIEALSLEIEFSRAMWMRDARRLDANPLSATTAWSLPHLWPRCKALRSMLDGDRAKCMQWLHASGRLADNAIDDGLVASEKALRECIARLPHARVASIG